MDEIRYIKTVYRKRGSGSGHMYSLMRFLDNTGDKYVWRVSRNDEVLMISERLGEDMHMTRQEYYMKRAVEAPESVSHQKHLEHKDYYQHTITNTDTSTITNTNTSTFNTKEFSMGNKEHVVVVMTRKSNESSSNDGEIKKLDKSYEKKGVVIAITPTQLQLVFKNGPNKAVEAEAAPNLYKRMHDKKLIGAWKFVYKL
ncbi:hypothetical protein FPSE5266_02255 [Fusarium pseudograminearum]|nr:hypothetical protein FPSE5266_02255 [Fusarium pseudograminearum]